MRNENDFINLHKVKVEGCTSFGKTRTIFLMIVIFCCLENVYSQHHSKSFDFQTGETYIIELNDESKIIGKMMQEDSTSVEIRMLSGKDMFIPFESINKCNKIEESNLRKGKYWISNPHASRYFLSPSALRFNKGELYYQNNYLLVNSFYYGITNNISLGGGFEFLSTMFSFVEKEFMTLMYFSSNLRFNVAEKVNFGAGFYYIYEPRSINWIGDSQIGYFTWTFGTTEHNLSSTFAWGNFNSSFSNPTIIISGMTRISKSIALITENYLIFELGEEVLSFGVRFFNEKLAVDLALINNRELAREIILGIPYMNFVAKF